MERILIRSQDLLQGIPAEVSDNQIGVGYTAVVLSADAQATIAALQARVRELEEWVQDQSTANLETMRHTDEMQSRALEAEQQLTQHTSELEAANTLLYKKNCALGRAETSINDLQAELERVSLLSSHNERRFEMLEEKYKDLRTLILALPKVEGEITVSHGYVKDSTRCHALFGADEDAALYAALLQERQKLC